MWFELEIVVFVVWTKPKWEFGWGNELIDEEWVYIVQFFKNYNIEKLSKHRYWKWIHILHLELSTKNYGPNKQTKVKLTNGKDFVTSYNFMSWMLMPWSSFIWMFIHDC